MTKAELIEKVAKGAVLTKADAGRALDTALTSRLRFDKFLSVCPSHICYT